MLHAQEASAVVSAGVRWLLHAGSGGEWLAWLLYGGGGMDAEDEDLRSGLGPSLKHASIVGLPLCLLILAMAGALWHLAGKEQ